MNLNDLDEEKSISGFIAYEKRISSLLLDVQRLEQEIKDFQNKCRHVFLETAAPSRRSCLICKYTETIFYRFSNNQ